MRLFFTSLYFLLSHPLFSFFISFMHNLYDGTSVLIAGFPTLFFALIFWYHIILLFNFNLLATKKFFRLFVYGEKTITKCSPRLVILAEHFAQTGCLIIFLLLLITRKLWKVFRHSKDLLFRGPY